MITMEQYLKEVDNTIAKHPGLRYGQTLFNTLYDYYPDLANEVRATDLDPFYLNEDEQIAAFMEWLSSKGVMD